MVDPGSAPRLKVLVFGASLRADSLNVKLAAVAARIAAQDGATVDHASLQDFDVPSYDDDAEKAGIPKDPAPPARERCLDGDIADVALRARFEKNLQAFLSLAEAAKNYPCMKRAWVEFLGEPPGFEADRVDPLPT